MSRMTGSSYEVARATGVCAATGRPLTVGERFVAVLAERPESDTLDRVDYSVDAWDQGARPAPPAVVVAHWRGVLRPREENRRTLVDDEDVIDLFEQLGSASEPRQLAFRYILALILVRKRLLKFAGTTRDRDGREVMLVRFSKALGGTEETPPAEVVDPGLDETTIAQAIEQVGSIMAADAAPPGATT